MNNDDTRLIQSLARIDQSIKSQSETNERISSAIESLEKRTRSLEDSFNQAKGGWFAIIAIPAVITALINLLMRMK